MRVPPDSIDSALRAHLRLQDEDVDRRFRSLERRQDLSEEVSFKSAGEGETVKIPHDLPFIPNRFTTVCKFQALDPYQVSEDLADGDFIYLATDAEKGSKFIVSVWRV